MLSQSQRTLLETKGVVVGRVLLGLLFFYSGISMLFIQGPANVAVFFNSLGIPLAGLMVWVVIALKIIAGGALMLGRHVEAAAGALVIFTIIATLIAHMDLTDPSLGKNLAIIGGLLYAAAHASASRSTNTITTPESIQ